MAKNFGRSSHEHFVPNFSLKHFLRSAEISAPLWVIFGKTNRKIFSGRFFFFHFNVKLVVRVIGAKTLRGCRMILGTFMVAEISARNFYIPQKLTLNIVILAKNDLFST